MSIQKPKPRTPITIRQMDESEICIHTYDADVTAHVANVIYEFGDSINITGVDPSGMIQKLLSPTIMEALDDDSIDGEEFVKILESQNLKTKSGFNGNGHFHLKIDLEAFEVHEVSEFLKQSSARIIASRDDRKGKL